MSQGGNNSTFSLPFTIPIPISEGGTGATSFIPEDIIYYDGTKLNSVPSGTSGYLLVSQGPGLPPAFMPASGSSSITITGNTGSATSSAFTMTGDTTGFTFDITGTTIALDGDLVVANGGTGRSSLTNHGVLVGAGTAAITQLAVGNTNTVLLGNTGADPSFGQVPNAALVNNSITLNSGTGITVTGSPIALGGAGTIALTTPVTVVNGGTERTSLTNHGVLVGAGTSPITQLAVGTTNTVLLGNTGADPSFGQVPNGALVNSSVTLTSGTGITVTGSPLSLGGAATIALTTPVSIANGGTNATSFTTTDGTIYYDGTRLVTTTTGSSGNVLTSGGPGVAPSYQSPAASSITISGNTGSSTGNSFTFTGGTTGLSFGSSAGTITTTFAGITANNGTVNLASDNGTVNTLNIGTGTGNGIAGKTINIGSSSTGTNIVMNTSSSIGFSLNTNNGPLTIASGTGTINISNDSTNTNIDLGTGAGVKVVDIGSTTGASGIQMNAGSAGMAVTSTSTIAFGASTSVSMNTGLTIDSTGRARNTKQPAFLAYLTTNQTNTTGDGTVYTIPFNATTYNQGSSFNTATGAFTAPISGVYLFTSGVRFSGLTISYNRAVMALIVAGTSAQTLNAGPVNPGAAFSTTSTDFGFNCTGSIFMTAGDVLTMTLTVAGSTKTIQVGGVFGSNQYLTWLSGCLLC